MKPSSKSFAHLAIEVIDNINGAIPKNHGGALDINYVAQKTPKEAKKILGHNYLKLTEE